jgi:hypothetical protein
MCVAFALPSIDQPRLPGLKLSEGVCALLELSTDVAPVGDPG